MESKKMKSEQMRHWVDTVGEDKKRKRHEETIVKCIFSPFLFGKSYVNEKWIKWAVEMKVFKDARHPKDILDKLEGPYFDVLDLVGEACNLVCTKIRESVDQCEREKYLREQNKNLSMTKDGEYLEKLVENAKSKSDLQSVVLLSEKVHKCSSYKDALKAAESNEFFCRRRKQLEAISNEKGEKIGFVSLFAIRQYSEYVLDTVVKERDIAVEMENIGPDDVVKSWHREDKSSALIQIPVSLLTGEAPTNFYRTKGNEAFKVGKYNDAVKYYSEAIDADRFNHILYSNRAQTNLNLRKFQEALCDARRAVILKPDWEKGHYRYAQAFYELGNIEKAKAVNHNGQVVCKDANNGTNSISYLKIQAEKFSEKESEEDEVPELVDASSSSSESAESDDESEQVPEPPPAPSAPPPAQIVFPQERQEIDIGVLQKILEHKHAEDEKARKQEEREKKREGKNKEREERKKQEAQEEEKRRETDARQKRLKEEKEKQKEAERAKKAEKKRKEEERALAEKARMEKLAVKHAIEETLKQGSDAFLDKRGRQAVSFYQKVQDLINQSTEQWGGLREEDYATYLYAWGMAGLESGIAKEVNDAVQRFDTMLSEHRHVRSPLGYYGLGYAYFKHCKFHEAFEPLDKCEKMAKKLKYVVETWPGTTQSIQETIKGQLEVAIDNLRDRCKNPPPADATCRHPECPARHEIYLTDPEFKGYVSFSCSEHCMIDYHVNCWKKAKSEWEEEILHDKDVIYKHCNTPDCLGEVISLTIYGSDGLPKVEAKGEQAKKEKGEKVKTKGSKNKSKQERKKQKKQEAKKIAEKGQGDNGDRLDSVTSSHSSHSDVVEELKNPTTAEKHDDDTMSSVSSRQGGSGTHDGDGNMSDIDDILDDDLPITIPDAAYVLKRDDMDGAITAPKKVKQSKTKSKKKKAKPAADLNIQLQFVDDGQRSLMTSDDVVSPDAKQFTPYTPNYPSQDNPFAIPRHLREQASNFERSLPPCFSQTVKEGQSFADMAKTTNLTETDEEKSQKIALLFHLSDLFDKLGPVVFNDPRLEMELDKLPDAQDVISRYGGLRKFLLQSSDFFVLEDHVSLARDQMKCHEMFTERNTRLQEAGLPPPPITGIGFNAAPARNNAVNAPHMPPVHFPGVTSDPVGSNGNAPPNGIGGVDALDNFDIPSSGKLDGIDDITMEAPSNSKTAADMNGQDIDKELDRVLEAQQLNGGNSLQSLSSQGEPFSTKTGTSPHGLGIKSVSVDISSLPSFDSGLGSMPSHTKSNTSSDNKNTLQSKTGTSLKTDISSDDKNNVVGDSVKELPTTNGGQIGGTTTTTTTKDANQVGLSTAKSVDSSVPGPQCDVKMITPANGDAAKVEKPVRDFADGMNTSVEQKLSTSSDDKVGKLDSAPSVDTVEKKSQVVEVDIREKAPSVSVKSPTMKVDAKLEIVGNNTLMNDEATVLAVDYQKLLARYKTVYNACKIFQEKRKNMKTLFTQTVVVKYRTTGMNTEPFMEFEELKVIKERLQGSLRDTMQKYMQLQMTSSTQMDALKLTLEKKDSKEKELTVAVSDAKRQHESDMKQWQIEKSRSVEDTKTRDSKIQMLESEKNILQTQLATKQSELEEIQRKAQVERDLWIAKKLKLQEAFQATERTQKLLLQRSMEAEILVLQERCKGASHSLEKWLHEGGFHLNNFKINLQRTPDNLKMKEGFAQWQNAVTENKQKLELLKSKYEEQIREIHTGRMLTQLPNVEVPQITKPTLPPLPPPGAFMGPRPGMIPPHHPHPTGVRPPVPIIPQSAPSPVNDSSPSPSPTLSQSNTNPTPSQPISVSVPVSMGDANGGADDGLFPIGPAKVTPAQVTVPLQESAPWPPAASSTPGHTSPPGMPAAQTAPSAIPAAGGAGLGAVGSSRPQSVSGANATPGNNRPVKQPQPAQNPAAGPAPVAAGTAKPMVQQQPRTNFERILFPLQAIFPHHNQVQLTKAIKEVRSENNGSLSGLSVDEIIRRASLKLKRQPPLRPPPSGTSASGAAAGANKTWQPGHVPQGQRQLAQGIMQGMAAQHSKFQWSSELGGSSAFGGTRNWDDDEDPCVICHEEMTPETTKVLDCGHRFHAECIKQWLNEQSTCPNCRNYTLLPDEYPSL